MTDIIIVGAGPAGLTAAVYGARAGKSVLILEKGIFGGQITFSPKIENYPGFEALSGNALAEKMVEQALNLGVEIEIETVTGITDNGEYKTVHTEDGSFEAKTVIIATGASHRRLHVKGEDIFIGNGISFCAVCDGAFFKGADVAVIGGGNSAMQEALLLSETAKTVTVIQNLATLTGEEALAEKMKQKENIRMIFNSVVTSFNGEKSLTSVTVYNEQEKTELILPAEGAFIAIGLAPATGVLEGLINLDATGYVEADESCLTNVPGVFTAGDCRKKGVRQITTATADGAVAALAACKYIG